jgi:putative tricarboxylic transport membrane protein
MQPTRSLPTLGCRDRAGCRLWIKHAACSVVVCTMAGASILLPAGIEAKAEDYPARPVTLVVPWPPGNSPDGIARILGPKLADRLGKPFIVENRPGAASILGAASVAKADPDGHSLLVGTSTSFTTGPILRKNPPYDPARDFVPLAMVGYTPFVLVVNPALPVHSVSDLIKLAEQKPGELSYGSGGLGHPAHIYAELLKNMTGIQMVHVPYKGSPPALNDVVGGHIPLMFADALPSLPLVADGKVRALAVSSSTRLVSAPNIPTMAEAGVPGFDAVGWIMLVAPAKTPAQIVNKLRSEVVPFLAAPDVQSWIVKNGMIPAKPQSPEDLQRFLDSEIARWRGVLEEIGIAGSL